MRSMPTARRRPGKSSVTPAQTSFVLKNTELQSPPCVPEVRLHLAGEIMPLWQKLMQASGDDDISPPYWAFAWAGGQAIARYLLDHREESAGKRVLDFAAGSGLCAISSLKAGAVQVLATDIDPYATAAMTLNAGCNGVDLLHMQRDLLADEPPDVDLILAGDICYTRALAERALAWLQAAHTRGTRVLIGDPGRDYFVPDGLVQLASFCIPTTLELESIASKRAGVFTFG